MGATKKAILIAENNCLRKNQHVLRPYTKRKVREFPNDKFARFKDIIAAEEASYKLPKGKMAFGQPMEEPVAEVQEMIIVSLNRLRRLQEID